MYFSLWKKKVWINRKFLWVEQIGFRKSWVIYGSDCCIQDVSWKILVKGKKMYATWALRNLTINWRQILSSSSIITNELNIIKRWLHNPLELGSYRPYSSARVNKRALPLSTRRCHAMSQAPSHRATQPWRLIWSVWLQDCHRHSSTEVLEKKSTLLKLMPIFM